MPISNIYSSPNDFWIQDGAIRFELNALDDPDKLAVSLAAGAVIMAWKQGVIDYNAGMNYRTWVLAASPTHFDKHEKVYVYVRLSRVGDTAQLVYPYEKIPLDPALYEDESDESDAPGYDLNYYYILLGALTPSIIDGQTVNREWSTAEGEAFSTGALDTDKYRREESSEALERMFVLNAVTNTIETQQDLTFIAGKMLMLFRMRVLGADNVNAVIERIATSASVEENGSDSALMTSLYGDRRFIRRDVDEETNAELTANKFIAKEGMKTDSIEERTAGEGVTMESEVRFSEDASFEGDIEASENSTATLPKVKSDWIESLDGEDLDTLFGEGFLMKMVGDKAHLFTDFLTVRMKAVFAELEIRKLSYVGGTLVLTPAGCVVSKVVEVKEGNVVIAYKCYMTSDDGTTATTNTFEVGDQAQCRTFNIESGVYQNVENKYYWRLVTAIGSDTDDDGRVMNFIVLSNRATETIEGNTYVGKDPAGDNDIPAEGDKVVGLGNQISPTERGNIIMLRTVADAGSDNAPSVSLYRGVGASPNPYSLTGKSILDFSPRDGMKILSDYLTIRSLSGDEKPISDYLGIYVVECSTLLVSTESISNVTPTVLGMTMNSTLYAVQIGEYLLRMGEETEEGTAIIKCKAALQSSQAKTYLSSGVLTAVNMKGSEVVSTIGSSSSGELQFAYSDIDTDCDRVRIALVIDGVEKATSSISIVYDGVDGKNAKFERFTDLGSWARILVSDSNTTDGSGNPVHTSTIKLKYSLAALLELVDGDSSTPITSLSGYTLLASYIYNGQSQNITTQFSDGRIAAAGEVDVKSAFSTLGKVISIALSRTSGGVTAELARLEIPIVIGEQEIYNRTNTMWESMYINDGGYSSATQTAALISAKVGELNTGLLATGIDIINREIAMTADKFTLQNNSGNFIFGADANGNLRAINITVEGVINNEIIELEHYEDPITHLPQDNLEDYFFKSTRTDQEEVYMFDPLAIGSVIDATLVDQLNGKNIHFVLPCLYYDGSYKLYGVRYLGKDSGGHATGRHYTFDEIRQCIGKKFYVMANGGSYNHFDFVCGAYDGNTEPGLFVNVQSGYFGLDKVNQGLQEWEDNPWEASRGKTIGSNNQTLGFYMFECKVGKYGNGYWIYWEYSRVAESYVYGDSMILGNEGDLPQDESDESSEE